MRDRGVLDGELVQPEVTAYLGHQLGRGVVQLIQT